MLLSRQQMGQYSIPYLYLVFLYSLLMCAAILNCCLNGNNFFIIDFYVFALHFPAETQEFPSVE